MPPEALAGFLAEAERVGVPVAEIGIVEAGEAPPLVVDEAGKAMAFGAGSFSHF